MNQLARIFLHMYLVNSDSLPAAFFCLYIHMTITAYRIVELRYLIILWVVRVEVVLTVKL